MIYTTKDVKKASFVTHGGTFHADEVMSTVILSKIFGDINVFRAFKVPENLPPDVIVYDIGYGKFDHHQKGGNGYRANGVPYASAGLLWKEFGHKIVKDCINPELAWYLIDKDLIQGIDAIDTGKMPKQNYCVKAMSFSQVISLFNPTWDSSEAYDEAFIKAVIFAEVVFNNVLANVFATVKAKAIVNQKINESKNHLMILDYFVPWQEALLSSSNPKANDIDFVIFPSNRGGYNWQCVPSSLGSFGQRHVVPDEWKGLTSRALQKITGIKTATFCHPSGFMGGAESFDDCVAFANLALAR